MTERSHFEIDVPNIYDHHPEGFGEVPASGTPVEVGLSVGVKRQDELQGSIENGELYNIAHPHSERGKAVGFRLTSPRRVSMYLADHSHGITKAVVAGAMGVAGAAVTAAIILYEHRKGKSE